MVTWQPKSLNCCGSRGSLGVDGRLVGGIILMLGIGIAGNWRNDGWSGGATSSVCVDDVTITRSSGSGCGVGSDSWNGEVGVFGGLKGSSTVCDEPFTIKFDTTGGLITNGWAM